MPFSVRVVDGEHCVFKKGSDKSLGCHSTPREAFAQIAAIEASEGNKVLAFKSGEEIFVSMTDVEEALERAIRKAIDETGEEERRLMLLVTSNAYRDREEEIIRQKALERYVDMAWKDGKFEGDDPLYVWHAGAPIGTIVYADMEGAFLIEVARELPNTIINLAADGEPIMETEIRKVWDALEDPPEDMGASLEFVFLKSDREDGVFERIVKTETSVLPRSAAANSFTLAEVIKNKEIPS